VSSDAFTEIVGVEPTYSVRKSAVLLGRSVSWLDQRVRNDDFVLRDGTTVQPSRTPGGYRRFTLAMLKDVALSSYHQGWFSMDELKSTHPRAAHGRPPRHGRVRDPKPQNLSRQFNRQRVRSAASPQ
jgi:hypothetical protein